MSISRKTRIALAVAAVAGSLTAAPIVPKKTALITIPAKFEVKASPTKVWGVVTSVDGFGTLTGFRAQPGQKVGSFFRIGDHVLAQVWEDKGRLVVTEFVPERELRVTWEPEKGHYLCQKRILLTASAGATTVEYWDRYTDDQPNAEETARQVAAETEKHVEAFQRLIER